MTGFTGNPRDVLARLRLACDPVKFAHTMRCREILARWLEGGSRPRDFKATRVRAGSVVVWCIELFENEKLVAHDKRHDHDDALSRALSQVGES